MCTRFMDLYRWFCIFFRFLTCYLVIKKSRCVEGFNFGERINVIGLNCLWMVLYTIKLFMNVKFRKILFIIYYWYWYNSICGIETNKTTFVTAKNFTGSVMDRTTAPSTLSKILPYYYFESFSYTEHVFTVIKMKWTE